MKYNMRLAFFRDMILLILAFASYVMCYETMDKTIGLFDVEINLLSKFGVEIGNAFYGDMMLVFFAVYACIIFLHQICKWTMAACFGSIASIFVPTLLRVVACKYFDYNSLMKGIILIVSLVLIILAMFWGFHLLKWWIPPVDEVVCAIVGIIPALVITFISFCNVFTIIFGEVVIGKIGYVVLAVVLDIILYGVALYLYPKYRIKYYEILENLLMRFR